MPDKGKLIGDKSQDHYDNAFTYHIGKPGLNQLI